MRSRAYGRDAQALQFGVAVLQVALQFRFAGREARFERLALGRFARPAVRAGRFPRAGPRPASRKLLRRGPAAACRATISASRSAARCLSARCSASASFRRRRSASRSECRCRVRCTSCPIRAASWSRSCSMGAIVNHPGVIRATTRKVRNPAIFSRKSGAAIHGHEASGRHVNRFPASQESPSHAKAAILQSSAFAFLSINFHFAFNQPTNLLTRYISGSGVPQLQGKPQAFT